ncbi:MAG: efflux transporter outer membrane subunit [Verrucomicrobiae bacterium]|nr:efflux transporter outer membrane subunit [Verrucomicrobiae bacterium]
MAWAVTGCTMAPKYSRPAPPVSTNWPDGAAYARVQVVPGAAVTPEVDWREFFVDRKLQQLIELALRNNRDLRLAVLNTEMARAMYGVQRAELFPSAYASASGQRQRASAQLPRMPNQPRTTERYDVGLGLAAWEVDLFGRIRSLKDAALQEYLASEHARRGAQLALMASVAQAYLALAADREALALAQRTYEAQKAAFELVQRQFAAGLVTELELRQAQIPVETAAREVARYTQLVATDENALGLLVGTQVPRELLPSDLGSVEPPPDVAAGLPSEVLLRRPDVLQAEAMLKAAYANIGAARAAFFPRISLTAAFGTASRELSDLFAQGSGTWNYGAQALMPIFDARTWSGLKVSKVQQKLALTNYERTIQNAFREVADALAVRGTIDQQAEAQQSLVNALTETYRLAQARFERGLDSYLTVLDAQRALFAAQQALVSLRLAQLSSRIQLYAALGGGWLPDQEQEFRATAAVGHTYTRPQN